MKKLLLGVGIVLILGGIFAARNGNLGPLLRELSFRDSPAVTRTTTPKPTQTPKASSPPGSMEYFGVGQLRLVVDEVDYLSYIEEQKKYSNIIGLSFEFTNQGIIAPKESYLAAVKSYEKTALMLGRTPWKISANERQALFASLKKMKGYENIDVIVAVDEPYLGDWTTPAHLKEIILETRRTFPGKEITVNYNPREFYNQNQGPNGLLFDEYLDSISFDMYPANYGVACDDEKKWKQKIKEAIQFFKGKTSDPIMYVGQGFSKKGCVLTPEMVQWSFDATNAEGIMGILFWFAEDIVSNFPGLGDFTGYTNPSTREAENKIIELGKRVIK